MTWKTLLKVYEFIAENVTTRFSADKKHKRFSNSMCRSFLTRLTHFESEKSVKRQLPIGIAIIINSRTAHVIVLCVVQFRKSTCFYVIS